MTENGREEYERWRREQARIDMERIQRQKDESGQWKREWDRCKPVQEMVSLFVLFLCVMLPAGSLPKAFAFPAVAGTDWFQYLLGQLLI